MQLLEKVVAGFQLLFTIHNRKSQVTSYKEIDRRAQHKWVFALVDVTDNIRYVTLLINYLDRINHKILEGECDKDILQRSRTMEFKLYLYIIYLCQWHIIFLTFSTTYCRRDHVTGISKIHPLGVILTTSSIIKLFSVTISSILLVLSNSHVSVATRQGKQKKRLCDDLVLSYNVRRNYLVAVQLSAYLTSHITCYLQLLFRYIDLEMFPSGRERLWDFCWVFLDIVLFCE